MFCFLYDCLLYVLVLFFLPKFWFERVFKGKFKKGIAPYLAFSLPSKQAKKGPVFLLLAVSVGETKAAASLFTNMKKSYPEATFYVASRTETGHDEAKKILPKADGHFFIPFDFSWSVKRFLRFLEPDVVLVVESDFWYNLFRLSKKRGAQLFLVSGKLSLRSYRRFCKVSFFTKRLFSFFDLICAQNLSSKDRFIHLGVDPSKVMVAGNLKFDTPFKREDQTSLKEKLGIVKGDWVLVVASTHHLEEEAILQAIKPLWSVMPRLKILLVPRHPERFLEVEQCLDKQKIPSIVYSRIDVKTGLEKVILIDAMGILPSLYQIANLAVLGGSFLSSLRGHNIFERVQAGLPVLFGPYMSDQKEFVESVLSSGSGRQVGLRDLASTIKSLFEVPSLIAEMKGNGEKLLIEAQGVSSKTWDPIFQYIKNKKEKFEF